MANPEHLEILKQGVEQWNEWRKARGDVRPDLSNASFPWEYSASLGRLGGNLRAADLRNANLTGAVLVGVNLDDANLSGAGLNGASIIGVDLSQARLAKANLGRADLRGANLTKADLQGVNLWFAHISDANVSGANFGEAEILETSFGNVDLSVAKGLETVQHGGPSTIGIDTIYKSRGKIPEVFLRGCGVPDNFIKYMHSLTGQAFEFYSCFISYSSKDQEFAKRLHADLQDKGVRCWFAPEDLKIGEKFQDRIEESIRYHDKLLLLLSENSIRSPWVEREVQAAFEREQRSNKPMLFPIRLDEAVMETPRAWAADIRRTRHIGEFNRWRDHDSYKQALERLLRDLRAESPL